MGIPYRLIAGPFTDDERHSIESLVLEQNKIGCKCLIQEHIQGWTLYREEKGWKVMKDGKIKILK